MPELMTAFVANHPCEVWTKDGQFHSRYASMLCAARTVLFLGGGQVIDVTPNAWDGVWDLGMCKKQVTSAGWVHYSRRYETKQGQMVWQ